MPIKRKVSFKLAHLGHMCSGVLSRNPRTINRDTWNQEENKTEEVLGERRAKFILTKEDGKLNEASLVGLAKHVRHSMNKQSGVCFFLQMVGFPPPHVFLFLSLCSLLSNPSGPQSSIGYSDRFRFPLPSGVKNRTKSDTFRLSQYTKTFLCSSTPV